VNDVIKYLIREMNLTIEVSKKWTLWIFAGPVQMAPIIIRFYGMH